jgi:hypothetical protein
MSKNPQDGDTITLNDNIFEFDNGDGVAAGNIPVTLATSLYTTSENLKTAVVNASYGVQ